MFFICMASKVFKRSSLDEVWPNLCDIVWQIAETAMQNKLQICKVSQIFVGF
jgi:hypothetical protein